MTVVGPALGMRMFRSRALDQVFRTVLLVIATGMASALVLLMLSTQSATAAAKQRAIDRQPVFGVTGELFYARTDTFWEGQSIESIAVAPAGANPMRPPGLRSLPRPGEVVMSPALQRLAAAHPTLAMRFSGMRQTAVGRSGLTDPGDLIFYFGAPRGVFGPESRVTRFSDSTVVASTSTPVRRSGIILVIVFVGMPLVIVCMILSRLGSRARQRRLAILRALGVSQPQLMGMAITESSAAVTIGAVIGLTAFVAWRASLEVVDVANVRAFTSDMTLGFVSYVLVIASLVALGVVGSALGASTGRPQTTVSRPALSERRIGRWMWLPLVAGLVLSVLALPLSAAGSIAASVRLDVIYSAAAFVLVGLALSLGMLVQRIARRLAHTAHSPESTWAARRLDAEPGTTTRLAGLLAVCVFLLVSGFVVAHQFDLRTAEWQLTRANYPERLATLRVETTLGSQLPVPRLKARLHELHLDGVSLLPVYVSAGRPGAHRTNETLVASCSQLRAMSADPIGSCSPQGGTISIRDPRFPSISGRAGPPDASNRPVFVMRTYAESGLDGLAYIPSTTLLVHRNMVAIAAVIELPPEMSTAEVVRGALLNVDPTITVQVPFEGTVQGAADYAGYGRNVLLAATFAGSIVITGVIGAAVDTVFRRRQQFAALATIGVPQTALVRSALRELVLPLLGAVLLAVAAAFALGQSYAQTRNSVGITPSTMSWALIAATGAVVIVSACVASVASLCGRNPVLTAE